MRRPETKANPAPAGATAPEPARTQIPAWLLAGLLALATVAVYWPATRCDFVIYDDDRYVTANAQVQNGLTPDNVEWAFSHIVAANWHPFTMLSHMMDCQIFGPKPWGHHLTNVLFHAFNTALVFLLLRQLAGATWRSLLVAALFAVHPLHVESVAWIAERKDVLSAFFGLLTLIFYARYAQNKQTLNPSAYASGYGATAPKRSEGGQPSTLNYFLALVFFALGLMCKPMLVTWPFVMLLLDYWPLKRSSEFKVQSSELKSGTQSSRAWRGEATCRVEVKRRRERRRLTRHLSLLLEKLPFVVLAAAASCVTALVQERGGGFGMVENLSLGARVGNALVSYCRYLWKLFWPSDLAVFYPHPGYWPLLLVTMAALWLVAVTLLFFVNRRHYPFLLTGWLWFGGTLVPVIGLVQVGGQAMADRYVYLPSLGVFILTVWGAHELTRRRRYRMVVLSVAGVAVLAACLGLTRQQLGCWHNSETLFRHALAVTQNNYLAHDNLGTALDRSGQIDEAMKQYEEAIRLKPDYALAHYNLGTALAKQGQIDGAITQYREAIRLRPNYANVHYNLGLSLFWKGQIDEGISQYREAIRLKPDFAEAFNNLGAALDKQSQSDEAMQQYQDAIRLKPDYIEAYHNLAAAYADAGRFTEAVVTAEKAERLATDAGEAALTAKYRRLLELYRSGKPYHEPAPTGQK